MSHIFISYSRQNADFVQRLVASLDPFYDTWIDREDLEPGVKWEKYIEEGITTCAVFVVVVTPHSNDSDWVARETLLAEKLQKYRIPVLLEGDLPFRLLNVQYVDFRGEYEGGLRDLLDILKGHLTPHARSSEQAHHLIGEGVSAYLNKDYSKADNLIAQALALAPDFAGWSLDQFWSALRAERAMNFAAAMRDQLRVLEQTKKLDETIYAGEDTYEWSVQISAPDEVVNTIDYVEYFLHPTFQPRNQAVRDAESRFRLTRIGWGEFPLTLDVHFKDGSVHQGVYELTFAARNEAALKKSA